MLSLLSSSYANENVLFKLGFSLLLLSPLALMLGIAPFDMAISLIGVLFLIQSAIKQDFAWLRATWVKIFFVLWLYMIIRGFFTIDPFLSVTQSLIFIRFAILALALQHWLLKKSSARELFVVAIILSLIFTIADGLIQLFTSDDLLGHHIAEVDFQNPWRLTAMSGKMNIGAKTMMMAIPAIAYLVLVFQKSSSKWLSYTAFILAIIFIIFVPLTGERNASLMMALGMVLLFFMYKPYRKSLLVLAPCVLVSLALIMHFSPGFKTRYVSTIGVSSHFANIDEAPQAAIPYAALFITDKNIFLKNMIFGVGRKQYNKYCEQMSEDLAVTKKYISQCITNAQNIYFEWLDETGLVGTILFLAMIFIWLRQFYIQRSAFLMSGIVMGALIEILLRLWPLASTSSFFFSWNGGPFWIMLGWVMAYLQEKHSLSIRT